MVGLRIVYNKLHRDNYFRKKNQILNEGLVEHLIDGNANFQSQARIQNFNNSDELLSFHFQELKEDR